jgi:ubiquinone/menaquinone biosynthesis C-methylase UbiE
MRVLDLGGGTGAIRPYLPAECKYISLDMEMPKLRGFRRKYPGQTPLLSDCTQIPVASRSIDVVLCMLMSHHLTDAALTTMLAEAKRVLKLGGQFIFLDCVDAPERFIGRLLWRVDRGSFPRRPEILTARIERVLPVVIRERFSVWHEYLLMVAVNQSPSETAPAGWRTIVEV